MVLATIISTIINVMISTPDLSYARALMRACTLVAGTLILVPVQLLWMLGFALTTPRRQSPVVRLWYKFCLFVLRGSVTVVNRRQLLRRTQKIVLCNHIGYIDILVLGAVLDCFFVAKSDVADWPIFGFLSKVGGTVFVSRKRQLVKKQIEKLKNHLAAQQSLLIFPEGTSTNGFKVLPFKSSLLNVLDELRKPPAVQPITLLYTHLNSLPISTHEGMDKLAWYGDMTLGPHLWDLLRQKSFQAKIIIHPTLKISDELNVKQLVQAAHDAVNDGFHAAIAS